MKISLSAKRLTAAILIKNKSGSYHGGMQQVSNIDGREVLWNFVKVVDGKTTAVQTEKEAIGIVCEGKFYKFASKRSSTSSDLPSRFSLGATVALKLQGLELESQILAIGFVPGKVLYTLAVYTGLTESDFSDQYGLINSIGWDANGREYIRISGVDSFYVEEYNERTDSLEQASEFNAQLHEGHGHVIPRADGVRMRCGALSTSLKCPVCAAEKRALDYAVQYLKSQN